MESLDVDVDYGQLSYEDWDDAQPYPTWAHARANGGVVQLENNSDTPTFMVTNWAHSYRVLRDWRTFSSSINGELLGPYMGELILGLDGTEHRQYRNLVAHAFRRSALERWRSDLIKPIINSLLDQITPSGRADLVAEVTSKFPVQVICGILGLPAEDHDKFNRWAIGIIHGPLDPEAGQAASQAMHQYFEPLIAARRADPRGDLLSELVQAKIDGHQLSNERIHGFIRLLLPAGAETTYRAFGSYLLALLQNPVTLQRVLADRSLVSSGVEETLRWESPPTMVMRVAAANTEIGDCQVPEGSVVMVLIGSASHDESRWDNPQHWDINREPKRHMAFGTGVHQCLGMHLAKLELEVGVNTVLDRLPGLRLDPNAETPKISGYAFRGPSTLPVLFNPT